MVSLARVKFPLSAVKSLAFFKPRGLLKQQAELCPNAYFFSTVTRNEKESKRRFWIRPGRTSVLEEQFFG